MTRTILSHRASEAPPLVESYDSSLNIMFLAAFPLLAWLFHGSVIDIATALICLVLLSVALRLIAAGQQRQRHYDAIPGARAPRLPRKLAGALLMGVMITLLATPQFNSMFFPLMTGALGAGLCIASFGLDPMRHKPALHQPHRTEIELQAELALERTDHALARIADRVAMLEDLELTRRTEVSRTVVLRLLRSFARDPQSLIRLQRPVDKLILLLDAESNRLCSGDASESSVFARRRYIAKLELLTESFEVSARKSRIRGDKDAFELEADLLLNRMPQHTAA